ncbi:MAG: glycerol kinase [Campylobacterota bacterium]|nr:glycerol kinase [Campylobacterota bacterium]
MSNIKLISTSQLAKNLSLSKNKLDELLLAIKYIEKNDNGFILTSKGKDKGGELTTHARFGTYIVWPETLEVTDRTITQGKKYISATAIGSKHNISARKINMILSEIGWIERYLKGWTISNLGMKNGGIQKENSKNGVPYVEWPEDIFTNTAFQEVIKEVLGDASEETQKKVNKSKSEDFRTKFEAKHRATDGHFVRSKAEMLIDNWLYMAEIVHAYERRLPIEEEMYCDFYIPTGKVYIEFWGLENEPKYLERKKIKKAIYEKYDFKLIELTDKEVFNLDDVLPKMLLKFGVQTY